MASGSRVYNSANPDHGDIPSGVFPTGASARTIALWVKYTGTAIEVFLDYGVPATNGARFLIYQAPGTSVANLTFTGASPSDPLISGFSINDGNWHLIIVRYDGITANLDIDGTSHNVNGARTLSTGTGSSPRIGGSLDGTFSDISVCAVGVWSVVLSDADVNILAGGDTPQTVGAASQIATKCLGYWPMRGVQSPEPDISTANGVNGGTANGNDMVMTGTTAGSKPGAIKYQTSPVTNTATGTTFFLPQTTSVQVEGIGGGQAGADPGALGGPGGIGGKDCNGAISGLTIDQAYKGVVGTGGAASAASGGDTTFNTNSIVAPGGNSGTTPVGTNQYAGGTGGTTSGAGGGGGGSSGGTSSVGNAGSPDSGVNGGAGGAAVTGGGAGGAGGNTGANGVAGTQPGGGGGGAGAAGTHAAGAAGQLVYTWPIGASSSSQSSISSSKSSSSAPSAPSLPSVSSSPVSSSSVSPASLRSSSASARSSASPSSSAIPSGPLVVTFPNINIYQSPYNWINSGGAAQATTPGPYLKGVVTGTTQITANLDTTLNNGISTSNNMPSLACFVVDRTATDAYGRAGVAGTWTRLAFPNNNTNGTPVTLATGLTAGHTYEFVIFCIGTNGGAGDNSWASTLSWAKINSLQFDNGATLSAYIPNAKKAVFLGDSNIQAYFGDPTSQASYLYSDMSTSWPVWVANAFGAEFMCRGIGGQGWVSNTANYGFPIFGNSWNNLDSTHVCDFTTPASPDYLFTVMGNNDHGQGAAAVTSAVSAWITAARGTPGLSATKFFVCIPPNQMQAAAIISGVAAAADANTFVLNLGTNEFSFGTNFLGSTASFESLDGLHLTRTYHGMVAAAFAQQAQFALGVMPSSSSSASSSSGGLQNVNIAAVNGIGVTGAGTAVNPWGPTGNTVAGLPNVNVAAVNGKTVGGAGTAVNPWGPSS
jgi:hypothetical protein